MSTTYTAHQYEMAYPPGIEHHWWTVARNRLIARLLRAESGTASRLLEVGCGKGLVVKDLKQRGFDIHGVELADVPPVSGAEGVVDSGIDACEWDEERRSRITGLLLLDVIEHLPDPETFLRKLESSFPSLAMVLVTVPTCEELWSNYDSFAGHHRRYSLGMLEELAGKLHWTTGKAGYFFRFSYLPMRLMTLLGIDRNLRIVAPGRATRPLHRLVSVACGLEERVVPRRIRGSSAYAVFYTRGAAGR